MSQPVQKCSSVTLSVTPLYLALLSIDKGNKMKHSLLVAALLALSVAACSKPAPAPEAAPAAPAAAPAPEAAPAPAAPAAPAADAAAPAAPAADAAAKPAEEAKH